jgi:hypothetical protein
MSTRETRYRRCMDYPPFDTAKQRTDQLELPVSTDAASDDRPLWSSP